MRKPVCAICKQQRHRSACTSAQSDQRLCCLLLGYYNTSTCYSRNFKTLASLISWAGRFESYLVANPKDRFSRDVAHIMVLMNRTSEPVCFLSLPYGGCALDKWACTRQNQQINLCAQQRLRSAWASAQSDQSLLSAWRNLGSLAILRVDRED